VRNISLLLLLLFTAGLLAAQDDKPSPVPSRSRRTNKLIAAASEYKIGTSETGEAVYFSRAMNGRKAASG
jgi:hypothetical protein